MLAEFCTCNERFGIKIIMATKYNSHYVDLSELSSLFEIIDENEFKTMFSNK